MFDCVEVKNNNRSKVSIIMFDCVEVKNGLKHSREGKIQSSTNNNHDVKQLFLSVCD